MKKFFQNSCRCVKKNRRIHFKSKRELFHENLLNNILREQFIDTLARCNQRLQRASCLGCITLPGPSTRRQLSFGDVALYGETLKGVWSNVNGTKPSRYLRLLCDTCRRPTRHETISITNATGPMNRRIERSLFPPTHLTCSFYL